MTVNNTTQIDDFPWGTVARLMAPLEPTLPLPPGETLARAMRRHPLVIPPLSKKAAERIEARLEAVAAANANKEADTRRPAPFNDNRKAAVPFPGIVSSGEFVRGFVPPDYAVDGIIQAGFVYSVTASSGTGKTAILLLLAALTALGRELGHRDVRKGRIVYFAGENPDDVKMRWIAMAHHMGFDPDSIDAHFVAGVFSIAGLFAEVSKAVDALGGVDLIIVDTSAAYFQGQDENGNVEMGRHARDLRTLTTVEGKPCVLVACHPTKSADQSNLLPRGGGAFIAEMDGNLTCARVGDGTVKLHWQGKHRGPDFEPVVFDLQTVTAPLLKDTRGRDVPTVMATAMSDGDVRSRKQAARNDEDEAILRVEQGSTTTSQVAKAADWLVDGQPHKRRAQTALDKLRKSKLVEYVDRKGWKLTAAGNEAAVDIRSERHREKATAEGIAGMILKSRK
ncbi:MULTISPECIES: AAA family ATPase [unclassified Mesorhizobium]|uniref:AAA family ATPase n=1 Tax=unclassified Mesorhizobium TaxID=325217 RepID=UPI0030144E16